MLISDPPSVSGWPALYQEPVYDLFWINSLQLQEEFNFMNDYLKWGAWLNIFIGNNGIQRRLNLVSYLKLLRTQKT